LTQSQPRSRPKERGGDNKWRYKIVPSGRWFWFVSFTHGMSICEYGIFVFGNRERAVRKAEKKVAKFTAQDARREALTVEGP